MFLFFLQFVTMTSLFFVVLITVGYPQSVAVSSCLTRSVSCHVPTCRAEFLSVVTVVPSCHCPKYNKAANLKKKKRNENKQLKKHVEAVVERRRAKTLLQYLCGSLTRSVYPMFGAN